MKTMSLNNLEILIFYGDKIQDVIFTFKKKPHVYTVVWS